MKPLNIKKAATIFNLFLAIFLLGFSKTQAQNYKITGNIYDLDAKMPLSYASVSLKGTTVGVDSDSLGNFSITTSRLSDTISVSMVGYVTVKMKLDAAHLTDLKFNMTSGTTVLKEAIVIAQSDPGKAFMKKVLARKAFNNPSKFENYSCESYNKTELDLRNVKNTELKKKGMKSLMLGVFNNLDTANVNKKEMPLYFVENLTNNFHSRVLNIDSKEVVAKKTLGLETDVMVRHIEKFNVQINPYDNWMAVFDKTFASPLSDAAFNFYKFYIEDSTKIDGHWQYKIQYIPKNQHENAFTGMMWINDSTFSLNRIEMRMTPNANLNFINAIKVNAEYALFPKNNTSEMVYMMKKYVSEVTFESGWELVGIPIKSGPDVLKLVTINTSVFDKIKIDEPSENEKSKLVYTSNQKNTNDFQQLNKDEEFWKTHRLENLTTHEASIYKMIDTLKKNKMFSNTVKVTALLSFGYWDFSDKVRIGAYSSLVSTNRIEGTRFRMNVWTLPGVDKKLGISGYLAYGTRDKAFKGGFGMDYIHNEQRWSATSFSARSDYDLTNDHSDEVDNDNLLSSLLRKRSAPIRRFYTQEIMAEHEELITPALLNRTSIAYRVLNPAFDFNYQIDPANESQILHKLPTAEIKISLIFAPYQRTKVLNYRRLALSSDFPIVSLDYTQGLKIGAAQFNYQKIDLSLSQNMKLPPKGRLYYNITAGKTIGTLPFLLLNIPKGNEFYVSNRYVFNTMTPYEFVTDKYVSLQTRLSLGGLILDHIPLLQKMGIRERATFNAFYGTLSDKNKAFNSKNTLQTLGKIPFMEAGVGVENIFHAISIEYIWRLNHKDSPLAQKSGLYMGIDVKF